MGNYKKSKKQIEYDNLVRDVAACRLCDDFKIKKKTGEIIELIHDPSRKHINLWAHWQGSLDAEILLIGQDWGRISSEEEAVFWANKNPYLTMDKKSKDYSITDMNLRTLFLDTLGIDIALPSDKLFFTNSVQCYKTGSLSNKTTSKWYELCNENFVKRLVCIIKPKVLITIGKHALNGLRYCGQFYNLSDDLVREEYFNQKFEKIVDGGFLKLVVDDKTQVLVLPLFHCGVLSCNLNRTFEQQMKDWQKLKTVIDY